MRRWEYKTASGKRVEVEADYVSFAPGHVVFYRIGSRYDVVVLAVNNRSCFDLIEREPT